MPRLLFLFLWLGAACQPVSHPTPEWEEQSIGTPPAGFPAIDYPADNAYTPARWQLGKQLFFEPLLSRDSSISCASCHHPQRAFSDEVAFSLGVAQRPGTRNAPSLANVAYHPYFTREGGVPTLEMQVLVPIQEHNEFDFNILPIAERLRKDSTYQRMSRAAYQREMDYFVITRALANFERELLSGNSPYDQQEREPEKQILSRSAERGRDLFFSEKTGCSSCHSGFNFSNYAFENNGLYADYPDPGRFRLTGKESDRARFKVPSLRNVALTAPYMHDGSLASLEEVIEHYNRGGASHPHKSELIRPLSLNEREKTDLQAFLHSLTDYPFIHHPLLQAP